MGIGDEIMVTGRVRELAKGKPDGWRVAIRDSRTSRWHRWHPVWEGNARIAKPGQQYDHVLDDSGGCRPYIAGKNPMRYTWIPYGPPVGELFLQPADMLHRAACAGKVVIHPHTKNKASPNKQWPWESWQALVNSAPDIDWVQIGDGMERKLKGVEVVVTQTFREACGAMLDAAAIVVHEGALHHAAAALGVPAVVIYGGFISPEVTGYEGQRALFRSDTYAPIGCGSRFICPHCVDAMQRIRPADVLNELEQVL